MLCRVHDYCPKHCLWEVMGSLSPLWDQYVHRDCSITPQVKTPFNCITGNYGDEESSIRTRGMCVASGHLSINIVWLGGGEVLYWNFRKFTGQQDVPCGSHLLSTWKMHSGVLGRIGYIPCFELLSGWVNLFLCVCASDLSGTGKRLFMHG